MRYLGMQLHTMQEWTALLSQSNYLTAEIDYYNTGSLVTQLERRVAEILQKPAALYFNKGMTAQLSLLKAIAEKTGDQTVALHPLSHIAYDEQDSYQTLLNIEGRLLGSDRTCIALSDLQSLQLTPATLCIELPLRRAGFLLPQYSELESISVYCKEKRIHRHLDGARLWEAACAYEKSEAEVASLFDSVYVSLYKGIGGLGGAVLAGEKEMIERCKVWRSRLAGDSFSAFPNLVSALEGLDKQRKAIPQFIKRAKKIGRLLGEFKVLTIPNIQTNGFVVFFNGEFAKKNIEQLNKTANELFNELGVTLFNQVYTYPNSEQLVIEIQVGSGSKTVSDDEVVRFFRHWIQRNK